MYGTYQKDLSTFAKTEAAKVRLKDLKRVRKKKAKEPPATGIQHYTEGAAHRCKSKYTNTGTHVGQK